jgi:hypothetical protein
MAVTLIEAVNASSTASAFLTLLTINAGDLPPLRVVNDLKAHTSRGNTFEAYPFSIILASNVADSQPTVSLTIDNVDQRIVDYIRGFEDAPTVKIEMVLSSSLDRVERAVNFLRLASVTYDALKVSGTLMPIDFLTARAVAETYRGTSYPSLVWG